MAFDYIKLLREIRDGYEGPIDAKILAIEAVTMIPQDQWAEVLMDVMKYPASVVLGEMNRNVQQLATEIRDLPPAQKRTRIEAFKAATHKQLWDTWMIATGDGNGYRPLAEATKDMLARATSMHEKKAAANTAKAKKYKKLMELMDQFNAEKVRDLPVEMVEAVLAEDAVVA